MARREYQDPPIHERMGAKGPEFFIRYRVKVLEMQDGKPVIRKRGKFRVLGPVKMGRHAAEREKATIMRDVNGQVYTIQSQIPFEEFLKIWREEHYRGLKATSQRYYDQQIDARILPAFTGRKLGKITALDIGHFMAALESAGLARSTRICTRAILGKIFNCAKKWGYVTGDNPAAGVEVGRSPGAERESWTPTLEEAQAVIAAAPATTALMVETAIWTGMRISEILGLRCKNLDLHNAEVLVSEQLCRGEVDTPKSKAGTRRLPLGHLAARFERLMGKPEDYVFRESCGLPPRNDVLNHRLRAAVKAAKLYHFGSLWHAFRRLHITLMSERLSLFDLRAQAGHAQISTTQRYVLPSIEKRRQAVEGAQAKVIPIRRAAG